MDKASFKQLLKKRSRRVADVEQLLSAVFNTIAFVVVLIENISDIENEDTKYDARILELATKKDNKVILPYVDEFCTLIKIIKYDAPIRACAKIIELLCVQYFVKLNPIYHDSLTATHLEKFTEACFDWMIADKATAIQAHSMYSLYLLGHKFDWIHPELIETINKSLPHGSIGYQNRGKKVIRAIEKGILLKLY